MHFTYKVHDKESHLQQGDLLDISGELKAVLEQYHQYYASNKDYKFLIVLTQSCDLVRRQNKPCNSKYISLAAVKPAVMALDKEFAHLWQSDVEYSLQVFDKENKNRIHRFVERLLNNNQPEYFYLEPDAGLGFASPMVAFLKLSVALRAEEHYKTCVTSRFGQLRPEFQAKLGWLVGNSYSRVGTPDWLPKNATEEEYKNRIESLLSNYVWSDVRAISLLRKEEGKRKRADGEKARLSDDEGSDILEAYKKEKDSRQENLARTAMKHVQELVPGITGKVLSKLQQRLCTAEDIRKHVRG